MNIVVLVKQVPDSSAERTLSADLAVDRASASNVINEMDEYAIEEALKIKEPFSQEYRLRRSDGVYRWIFDVASPRFNGDGSFAGFIGSAIDTTDQKLAQQALAKVSGQLIDAQEKERSRIARDLHDDICQRLALLSMEIGRANSASRGSPEATQENLEKIPHASREILVGQHLKTPTKKDRTLAVARSSCCPRCGDSITGHRRVLKDPNSGN